jgi:hypothetical protein
MSSGNLGIDRDLFWEAGGFDESFNRWGGEDNEFGYRAIQRGAVVIAERKAVAWHQGVGHELSEEETHSLWLQRAMMRHLITDQPFRVPIPGRQYKVPNLIVHVDPDGQGAEKIGLSVSSILAGSFTDLVVGLGPVDEPDDAIWLESTFGSDPRVHLDQSVSDLEERYPFASARMTVPAGFGFDTGSIGQLTDELRESGVGAIHITLPKMTSRDGMAELRLTRAVNRARVLQHDDIDVMIGQLFGERWLSGSASGIWMIEDSVEASAKIRMRGSPAEFSALQQELAYTKAQFGLKIDELSRVRSRRALRLADGFGELLRARSWAAIRSAFGSIGSAASRSNTETPTDGTDEPDQVTSLG